MAKCEKCGKEFKNKRGLKIHKAKKHKGGDSKKEEKKVQICPKCGSPRLGYASMDTRSVKTIIGLGAPEKYYCKDCGYEGSVKLEVPISEIGGIKPQELRKRREEKKKKPYILKPIFITVIIAFLIATALITLRGVDTTNVGSDLKGVPSYSSEELNVSPSQEIGSGTPGNYTGVEDVSESTGIQESTGFMFPMFIIFLFVGLLVYMIWFYSFRVKRKR